MNIHKSLHKIVRERERQRRKYQRVKSAVVLMIALFIGVFIGNVFLQNNDISITGFVASGSLPNVGGSTDNWGNILNDYLLQEHTSTGAHGNVTAENLSVSGDVNVTGNLSVGDKITFRLGEAIDNLVDGLITITGDLNVTNNLTVNENAKFEKNVNVTGNVTTDNVLDSSGNTVGVTQIVESVTLDSSGGTINHTFEEGYDYWLKIEGAVPNTDGVAIFLRVTVGGTEKSGASDYSWAMDAVSSAGRIAGSNTADSGIQLNRDTVGNVSGENFNSRIEIHNPASTSLYTTFYIRSAYQLTNATPQSVYGSAQYAAASDAIDGIILDATGATTGFSAGTMTLYRTKRT